MEQLRKTYNAKNPTCRLTPAQFTKLVANMAGFFNVDAALLITSDLSELDYNMITKWCGTFKTRFALIELMTGSDWRYMDQFKVYKTNLLALEEKILEIKDKLVSRKGLKGDVSRYTKCIRLILNKRENGVEGLSVKQLVDLINDIHEDSQCITLYTKYEVVKFMLEDLQRKKDMNMIENIYREKYSLTVAEKFKLESKWKKDTIEGIEKLNLQRLQKTSAYPDRTCKKQVERYVNTLKKFENYVKEHYDVPPNIEVLKWFFGICTIEQLKEIIIDCSSLIETKNERVKSKNSNHFAKEYIEGCLSMFKNFKEYLTVNCQLEFEALKSKDFIEEIEDIREIPTDIRRHFYQSEIDRIFDAVATDPMYTLLFRILHEIGLRVGALVMLKISDMMTADGEPRSEVKVIEKGNKYRTFIAGDNVKEDLMTYINTRTDTSPWLFPSPRNINKPIRPDSVQTKIKRLCNDMGIVGMHLHPHAFRHTLVNTLMDQGNDMTKVSKFIGHSSIQTTEKYYWTAQLGDIVTSMNIPWLNKESIIINKCDEETEEMSDERFPLLVSILATIVSLLTQEQKVELKKKIPNIDTIIDKLMDELSTIASTATSSQPISQPSSSVQNYI